MQKLQIFEVYVHSNDDHSDEVFVCPETTKHHNCRNVTVTFIRLAPKLALKSDLKAIREQIEVQFNRCYEASVELGKDVDVEPALPRIANRQRHRDNVPAATPVQYFQRSLCIPLMDHLIHQLDTYFSEIQTNVSN